ncbi:MULTISPECIES: hypothetical protein [unclassified Actinomyces]|uniref:hypothetical protein n=1 Tax=unclassified Actinomyces TaxID=2609248 RepID=UPI002016F509|nr:MULTISPECIES: hypothetical protein [unclassified Actinomyces]MCL3778235.1 hypothetical protein [Actinomyces sp. AC-20-1]MCL3789138.1 hypothetical protein [Actinomyces sp. 187325]MCL3791493.1 hypothetical protein [Actinomyces sp. 186855]MCL3794083.1 hypothetical protein [Actinomyces sp. 217892]
MTGQDVHPARAAGEDPEDLGLALVVGERYPVGQRQHTLTPRLALATARARSALIEAARERDVLTYGELSEAIGGLVLPRHMGPLLHMLEHDCAERDEPGLAALVVSAATGEVGTPDTGWAPPQRRAVWAYWAPG